MEETMDKNEKADTTDDSKINYRGWKAMPFVIGKRRKFKFYVIPFSYFLLILHWFLYFSLNSLNASA